jgi:CRISPR-associated protein Csb1
MIPSLSDLLERCCDDRGPVAFHLRETLLPIEGRGAPFYPPTFAFDDDRRKWGKYNVDVLADGTAVALVDSVGSQANRMEPIFLRDPHRQLVPQVDISYGEGRSRSLLEAGHRLGDAIVRSTLLADEARAAFVALDRGDALPLARLAPTSLVFGAWDSRDTGAKVPRIVQSVIRAWSVSRLTRSAQFVPALDYQELGIVEEEAKLKGEEKKGLAERGFLHVPATAADGGIVADGPITRDLTVNLVALRRLGGPPELRRYLLGLSLVAATEPQDPFLRQGCVLVPDEEHPAAWTMIHRNGHREAVSMAPEEALAWAVAQAEAFGVKEARVVPFDPKLATADAAKAKKKKEKTA